MKIWISLLCNWKFSISLSCNHGSDHMYKIRNITCFVILNDALKRVMITHFHFSYLCRLWQLLVHDIWVRNIYEHFSKRYWHWPKILDWTFLEFCCRANKTAAANATTNASSKSSSSSVEAVSVGTLICWLMASFALL